MLVYKEDFTKERQDKEKTQCEKEQLQEQLQNCQELITALNQEVMYSKNIFQNTLYSSPDLFDKGPKSD